MTSRMIDKKANVHEKKIEKKHLFVIFFFLAFHCHLLFASSLNFMNAYDTDGESITNPTEQNAVPSYIVNGAKVFAISVVVDATSYAQGTEATLKLFNSTDTFTQTGKVTNGSFVSFVMVTEYSPEGYFYNVEISGNTTETRKIMIDPNPIGRYEDFGVMWITLGETYSVQSFPFTVEAQTELTNSVAQAKLTLISGTFIVEIPGQVSGNHMQFSVVFGDGGNPSPSGEAKNVVIWERETVSDRRAHEV